VGEPACFNLPIDTVVTAYLGLGTNIGDRERNLQDALKRISAVARIDTVSSVYETEPVGFKEQEDFWNVVARVKTDLPAAQLMDELIAIEKTMGRERSFPNAPRIIDIDILLYDDVRVDTAHLQIPHPRLTQRAFVLKPLLEIAPHLTHYAEILQNGSFERAEVVHPPLEIDHAPN
jgi:2-amino-4-hydroxy-6-hydroxymethyldihydropteridine diphosphokinase